LIPNRSLEDAVKQLRRREKSGERSSHTANCAVYQGATPVFADIDPAILLVDPADVEPKITPHTRVIIAVDYAGQPCDYDTLQWLAKRYGLALVADACHSLGGSYKGDLRHIMARAYSLRSLHEKAATTIASKLAVCLPAADTGTRREQDLAPLVLTVQR
jgi:hypothetical protein